MSRPLVSVCIGSIRPATLATTIDSILRQTYGAWELIVVGQGSDPALPALVADARARDGRIRYVHSSNTGLSFARNAAIAASQGDIIAMTDDDCEAREDWLETIVECFDANERLALVGGKVEKPVRTPRLFAMCPAFDPPEALYVPGDGSRPPAGWDWIGANFAFRHEAYDLAGAFDPYLGAGATFPAGEDTDFKLRLEKLRALMLSAPRAVVVHTHGYRYGLKSLMRNSMNYATGNGGLAGKLTLQGDPRGEVWLHDTYRQCVSQTISRLRVHRLPGNLLRWRHFRTAYARCLRDFEVDSETGLLNLRDSRVPSGASVGALAIDA